MAKELYIGHISENAYEEDIRKLFSVMGAVTSVHLIIDPETREFKRCGYVRMAADVDINEVVETLDGAYLVDQIITVSIARPQKPGMSKSGKSGKFGGPRKPGFGGKISAAPRADAEPKARQKRNAEDGRKPTVGAKSVARPKPKSGDGLGTGQKGGRGQKTAGRSALGGGRTTAPKPRRP